MSVPLVFVPVSPWSVVLAAKAKGVSVIVMHSAKNAARSFRVIVHSSLICSVCFGSLSGAWVGPGPHPFGKMVAYSDSRGKWFLMFLCKKISDVPLWNILVGRGRVPSLSSVFFPAFPVLSC